MNVWRVLAVGASAIVGDILWAKYTMHAAARQAIMAATWGGLIPVAGAVAVRAYVDDSWYLVPYAVGCWIGTYGAVRFHRKVSP